MIKKLGRQNSLTLVRQPVQEKENYKFKPALLCLKIDLMLHPTYGVGIY